MTRSLATPRAFVCTTVWPAVSVDGALRKVAEQPYGTWLLALVATGLIVFALFSFAEVRYRRL